jgi:hypothetical protein
MSLPMVSAITALVRTALVLFIGFALAACQEQARLSIAPGSTAANLSFVLSAWSDQTPGRLNAVYVARCSEVSEEISRQNERVWAAWVKGGAEAPTVGQFSYGKDLAGLITISGPQPLVPGCYIARAYASFPDPRLAVLTFRVTEDGQIAGAHDS